MFAPLNIIAVAEPSSNFIGLWVLAASVIINLVGSVVTIIVAFRRQPPVAEMMHAAFATKIECEQLRTETADSFRRIHGRVDQLVSENNRNFADAERAR